MKRRDTQILLVLKEREQEKEARAKTKKRKALTWTRKKRGWSATRGFQGESQAKAGWHRSVRPSPIRGRGVEDEVEVPLTIRRAGDRPAVGRRYLCKDLQGGGARLRQGDPATRSWLAARPARHHSQHERGLKMPLADSGRHCSAIGSWRWEVPLQPLP